MPLLPQRPNPRTISVLSQDIEVNQFVANKKGDKVDVAGTGREALATLENQRYHTLLMQVPKLVPKRQEAHLESALADLPVESVV